MKTLVIIPCYNEEENIAAVLAGLKAVCPGLDYLVVNDCSTDGCATILKAGRHPHLNLPVNLGIGGGVQSGYLYAAANGYDVAVQFDGDGQHRPEDIAAVLAPVRRGELDMCIGSRFITKQGFQTSAFRRFGIRLLSFIIRLLCGAKVKDVTSGMRACARPLFEFFSEYYAQDYPEPEAVLSAVTAGYRVGEVPVVMAERRGGKSSISPLKGAYFMVKVAIALVVYRMILSKHRREK